MEEKMEITADSKQRAQDNGTKNEFSLLKNIGMNEKQIEDFFTRYNEINPIKMIYDSNVDEQTPEKCHEKIANKGATITFIKKGNKFIGGITYQDWNSQRDLFLMFMQTSFQSVMR